MRELKELYQLMRLMRSQGSYRELAQVKAGDRELPVVGLVIGSQDRKKPTLGLFGGVHGLERVGTHVVLNYLKPLVQQLKWDKSLKQIFENFRIVSIPIVNPGGMYLNRRSNPNGVDIMRNAPVEASGDLKWLVSGHRLSPRLPWFRGFDGGEIEVETKALVDFVREEMFESEFAIAVDVHSGFGMDDRLWYPYSSSNRKFPHIDCVHSLKNILNMTLPYHVYRVQAQADSYLLHGDPWDLLYNEHFENHARTGRIFIPWCLEMGSWTWLRKNPSQLFTKEGIFNPILPHRYRRIMRRHKPLFDFLRSAVSNHGEWYTKAV
jgi:hypothetical protein